MSDGRFSSPVRSATSREVISQVATKAEPTRGPVGYRARLTGALLCDILSGGTGVSGAEWTQCCKALPCTLRSPTVAQGPTGESDTFSAVKNQVILQHFKTRGLHIKNFDL